MSELKMREEFEAWAIKDAASTDKTLSFERGGEWYLGKDHQVMNLGWAAWQASREALVIELTPGDLPGDAIRLENENDQLKAENEALRNLKLPDYLHLSAEMRERGDHAELRAREDGCASVNALHAVFFEAAIQVWLDNQQEAIDAAAIKGSSQ